MKNRNWILALVLLIAAFALTACGGDSTPAATATPKPAAEIDFTVDLNYDGAPAATVRKIKEGGAAEEPAKPVRENYEFTGWYADAAASRKFDFEDQWDLITELPQDWGNRLSEGTSKILCPPETRIKQHDPTKD